MDCLICSTPTTPIARATVLNKHSVQYFRCPHCGHTQTESPYWLEEAYANPIARTDVGYVARNLRMSAIASNLIAHLLPEATNFLDYGGGYGLFTRLMRDYGYPFEHEDLHAPNLFAKGHEATKERYDLITCFEVLEHLPNPREAIALLAKRAPLLLLSTEVMPPSNPLPGEWDYYALEDGQHISLFSERSLSLLADQCDLHLLSIGNIHLMSDRPLDAIAVRGAIAAPAPRQRASLLMGDYQAAKAAAAPFKVLIDGYFFQISNTGIATVWRNLLEQWSKAGLGHHFVVLDRGNTPRFGGITYVDHPPYTYATAEKDREAIAAIYQQHQCSLFTSTYYTTPPADIPSAMIVHDMIPEVFGEDLSHPMWADKQRAIAHASKFLAVSHSTKRDLLRFHPAIAEVAVSHPGCPKPKPATSTPRNYFLFVGERGTYKNAELGFRAIAELPKPPTSAWMEYEIICVGKTPMQPELKAIADAAGIPLHLERASEDRLVELYQSAIALIYPSRYEGFGLPILEAMAYGCPVVTCANSSITEVAGNAALYVDPDDVGGMKLAMLRVQDPTERDRLQKLGFERVKQFSWERFANEVWQWLKTPAAPNPDRETERQVMTWLDNQSPVLEAIGDADFLAEELEEMVTAIALQSRTNLSPLWRKLTALTASKLNCMPAYFSDRPSKSTMRARANLIMRWLDSERFKLDHEFPAHRSPGKLRLGIYSQHWYDCTETWANIPLFEHIDRSKFEVILLSLEPPPEHRQQWYLERCDRALQLGGTWHQQVQDVRSLELDFLVIGNNVTAVTNPATLMAAHRLARVQLVTMNSPISPCLPFIDYYLHSDKAAGRFFDEDLLLIEGAPQCFSTVEPRVMPPASAEPEGLIYVSGANFHKLTPEVEHLWAELLRRLPEARLRLFPFNPYWSQDSPVAQLRDRLLATFGETSDRVELLPAVSDASKVLEYVKSGHVYLDVFPFSGMTSILDPLLVGVPPVVMELDCPQSYGRGAAFLRELGVGDLVARSPEQYLAIALLLAEPEARLNHRRAIALGMAKQPSFLDSALFGQRFGEALLRVAQYL